MKQRFSFLQLSAIVFGIIIVFYLSFHKATPIKIISAQSTGNVPLSGYAWSSNIGWISFSGANYGVQLNLSTGALSGYAWSSNIGWINFAPDTSNAPENPKQSAALNSNKVIGWARAVAPISNPNGAGSWDGWIKMSGNTTDNNSYGVTYSSSTGKFSGDAWGGDVVGWISFNGGNDSSSSSNNYNVVISSTSTATSTAAILSSIGITPTNPSITVSATQQFTAIGHYSDGTIKNLTTTVNWSSSNTSVATIINSQGLATGIASGTTTITASYQSITSSTILTVTSATSSNGCSSFGNPKISWLPVTVLIGQPITFKYTTSSNPQLSILSVQWNFGQNASPQTSTSSSPTVTFSSGSNSRIITLTVMDSSNNTCIVTKTLYIGGRTEY